MKISYYSYFLHLVKQNGIEKQIKKKLKRRLRKIMKIAISTENDEVFPHFGRAPQYTFITIEEGELKEKKVFSNPGHTIGAVPRFVKEQGAEYMITGGMGHRAIQLFQEYGIEIFVGISGKIDDVSSKNIAAMEADGNLSVEANKKKLDLFIKMMEA